ncbi:hypothetical protein FA15DRAFT_670792 [Coprinopsis marcescibilis]|uniref:Uncharacterized protein n=1 Tax=Coprinopsis marcescibilis TaxID=230819 RepID=A0A5C3L4N7_COPMA|nr:hypothetical protein FA15DRAFT_670792 [Coprinopsis marcescibilis]
MATPSHYRLPAVPNPTPATVIHARPGSKLTRPPIQNPYDKFNQGDFDAWIGGITSKLRKALGQEDSSQQASEPGAEKQTGEHTQTLLTSKDGGMLSEPEEDSYLEDSFAEFKARRSAKGKDRDPREGPGLGGEGWNKDQPIELVSDDDEEQEERPSDDIFPEHGVEEWGDGALQPNGAPFSHPDLCSRDSDVGWSGEGYVSGEDENDGTGMHEYEEHLEVDEDELYSDEEHQPGEGAPHLLHGSSQAFEYNSDSEADEEEDYEAEVSAVSPEVFTITDSEEEEEREEDREERYPQAPSLDAHNGEEEEIGEEDDVSQDGDINDSSEEDDEEEVQFQEDTLVDSIPDESDVRPTYNFISDDEEEEEIESVGEDIQTEHELLVEQRSSPMEIEDHKELPVDQLLDSPAGTLQYPSDDENDEIQPMELDTSFPPHETGEETRPIDVSDPWSGPHIYAEDFYAGGDAPIVKGRDFVPELLEDAAAESNLFVRDTSIHEETDHPVELPDVWEGPRSYAEDFYSGGGIALSQEPLHPDTLEEDLTAAAEAVEEAAISAQGPPFVLAQAEQVILSTVTRSMDATALQDSSSKDETIEASHTRSPQPKSSEPVDDDTTQLEVVPRPIDNIPSMVAPIETTHHIPLADVGLPEDSTGQLIESDERSDVPVMEVVQTCRPLGSEGESLQTDDPTVEDLEHGLGLQNTPVVDSTAVTEARDAATLTQKPADIQPTTVLDAEPSESDTRDNIPLETGVAIPPFTSSEPENGTVLQDAGSTDISEITADIPSGILSRHKVEIEEIFDEDADMLVEKVAGEEIMDTALEPEALVGLGYSVDEVQSEPRSGEEVTDEDADGELDTDVEILSVSSVADIVEQAAQMLHGVDVEEPFEDTGNASAESPPRSASIEDVEALPTVIEEHVLESAVEAKDVESAKASDLAIVRETESVAQAPANTAIGKAEDGVVHVGNGDEVMEVPDQVELSAAPTTESATIVTGEESTVPQPASATSNVYDFGDSDSIASTPAGSPDVHPVPLSPAKYSEATPDPTAVAVHLTDKVNTETEADAADGLNPRLRRMVKLGTTTLLSENAVPNSASQGPEGEAGEATQRKDSAAFATTTTVAFGHQLGFSAAGDHSFPIPGLSSPTSLHVLGDGSPNAQSPLKENAEDVFMGELPYVSTKDEVPNPVQDVEPHAIMADSKETTVNQAEDEVPNPVEDAEPHAIVADSKETTINQSEDEIPNPVGDVEPHAIVADSKETTVDQSEDEAPNPVGDIEPPPIVADSKKPTVNQAEDEVHNPIEDVEPHAVVADSKGTTVNQSEVVKDLPSASAQPSNISDSSPPKISSAQIHAITPSNTPRRVGKPDQHSAYVQVSMSKPELVPSNSIAPPGTKPALFFDPYPANLSTPKEHASPGVSNPRFMTPQLTPGRMDPPTRVGSSLRIDVFNSRPSGPDSVQVMPSQESDPLKSSGTGRMISEAKPTSPGYSGISSGSAASNLNPVTPNTSALPPPPSTNVSVNKNVSNKRKRGGLSPKKLGSSKKKSKGKEKDSDAPVAAGESIRVKPRDKGKGKEKNQVATSEKKAGPPSAASIISGSSASEASRLLKASSRTTSRESSVISGNGEVSEGRSHPSPTVYKPGTIPQHSLIHHPSLFHAHGQKGKQNQPAALTTGNYTQKRQTRKPSYTRLSDRSSPLSPTTPQAETTGQTSTSSRRAQPVRTDAPVPVTRSHCRFHKISIPKEDDDGPRIYFIVPGCCLNNEEVIQEEDIVNLGIASYEESTRMVGDVKTLGFKEYLILVLRLLVGREIYDANEVYYLPAPGEVIVRTVETDSNKMTAPSKGHDHHTAGSSKTSTSLSAALRKETDLERHSPHSEPESDSESPSSDSSYEDSPSSMKKARGLRQEKTILPTVHIWKNNGTFATSPLRTTRSEPSPSLAAPQGHKRARPRPSNVTGADGHTEDARQLKRHKTENTKAKPPSATGTSTSAQGATPSTS